MLQQAWEERAKNNGISYTGVLLKNLGDTLNHYLHQQHCKLVTKQIVASIPLRSIVLDLACGYGRLSKSVRELRPDIQIYGSDFSLNYCREYLNYVQMPAICADLCQLPFLPNSIDGIIAVTALMYLPEDQQSLTVKNLMALLKPGGKVLFIDAGAEFQNVMAGGKKKQLTSGMGLTQKEYFRLGQFAGVKHLASGGFPIFSIMLPILYFIRNRTRLLNLLLPSIGKLDTYFNQSHKFTVHRWMVLQKEMD